MSGNSETPLAFLGSIERLPGHSSWTIRKASFLKVKSHHRTSQPQVLPVWARCWAGRLPPTSPSLLWIPVRCNRRAYPARPARNSFKAEERVWPRCETVTPDASQVTAAPTGSARKGITSGRETAISNREQCRPPSGWVSLKIHPESLPACETSRSIQNALVPMKRADTTPDWFSAGKTGSMSSCRHNALCKTRWRIVVLAPGTQRIGIESQRGSQTSRSPCSRRRSVTIIHPICTS